MIAAGSRQDLHIPSGIDRYTRDDAVCRDQCRE